MLSLDSIKTRTIYSKSQISNLYSDFKQKLNDSYDKQSSQSINNTLLCIRMFYYLADIPCFLRELNQIGEIQMMAQLQVLFMKCSHWKSQKQIVQKWVSAVMGKIGKVVTSYTIKQQIMAIQFHQDKQQTNIQFFASYLDKVAKSKNQSSTIVAVSFLRVFLIDQLQNKRKQLNLSKNNQILPQWRSVNESLIKICHDLQNLKYEQICVSICYWLCSQNKQFIKQCVLKGAISFLCRTLSNKNISEWYGRKVLSFLKLLLLGLEGKSEYFSASDIESCIAQFTLKHDSQQIMEQARSLFSFVGNGQGGKGKIQKQSQTYEKYTNQKNQKNLQNAIKNSRILLLYSEDEIVKKQINQQKNLDNVSKLIKKQDNIYLLSEIMNIVAYNNSKVKNEKYQEIDGLVIERVSALLKSDKDKNQLTSNNKKMLITLIRMLKQLAQSRQLAQKLVQKIKSESIIKKFSKFSDCTNFRYERQLLSLIRVLTSPFNSKDSQQKSNQTNDIMKNLIKQINENSNRRVGKRLQDQLEQLQLIYEMLHRGQTNSIKPEVLSSLFQKIKTKKTQTEQVQISILDQSEQERNREIINRINYLALACLQILQNSEKNGTQKPNPQAQDLDKILSIGLSTEHPQTLKVDLGYLISLSDHNKLLTQQNKQKVSQIYRRYKQMVGDDTQLNFINKSTNNNNNSNSNSNTQQQNKANFDKKYEQISKIIQHSFKQDLNNKESKQLENALLNQDDIQLLKKYLSKYQGIKSIQGDNSLSVFLKFLLRLSQMQQFKKQIFQKFSVFLSSTMSSQSCSDFNRNFIFKIYSELCQQNIENNKVYFTQQLTKSYQYLTKDSVQFTNNCLSTLQYSGSAVRLDLYWKYIYNAPDMISRQAAQFIIANGDDSAINERFWSFFAQPVIKNTEQEKKLTLHFIQQAGGKISKEIWDKFQLQNLLDKCIELLETRNKQIHSKTPTQGLIRRLLRLTKAITSILQNQNIPLSDSTLGLYQNICKYLLTHPNIQTKSKKLQHLNQQYIKHLVILIKSIYRRREGFNMVKKQLKIYQRIVDNVQQYKNAQINDNLVENYRILMLRDDKHQEFQIIQPMWNNNKGKITQCVTQVGAESIKACERIIQAIKSKNQEKFKKQYLSYFFPSKNEGQKESNKETDNMSDEQLLKHLKNLLNPPYQYGLNALEKHLREVQNAQFSNILVQIFTQSQRLMKQDQQNAKKSLQQVQKSVVNNIWGPGIQLNSEFYKMIKMNVTGLRVCLKTKGIGSQGTSIVCQKFFQYPEQIPLCAQILFINVTSSKQLAILSDMKIPELVNVTYKSKGRDQKYGKSLANLVGSSSKLKKIQNQYKIQSQLFQNLEVYIQNIPCLAATLYGISGLVYLNDQNQRILATKDCITTYLKVIQQNSASSLIFDKGCNLLSNLVYKNVGLVNIYIQMSAQSRIVKIASSLLYDYSAYKQFLRLMGNLSLSLQAANLIVKTQFLYLWSNILKQSQIQKHQDMLKYSFDIIFNLLNYNQLQSKTIAYKIQQAGCTSKIISFTQRNCLNSGIVQSGLDALQKLMVLQISRKDAVQKGLFNCMEDIAKMQTWNQCVLEKWIKLLNTITKDHQIVKNSLLKSEIFGKLALFIKQHPEIKYQYLNAVVNIADLVYAKGNHASFGDCGFVDLLVQLLKNKYVKSINAATIIDNFVQLHQQRVLTAASYTKVFSGLMSRLQIQFRDQNSNKIITAITKIRDHIIINTRAASILLQFSYIFLTQSQIITSIKYHKRVREYICLLSYFIAFSIELKIIFRESGFIQILNSWIKVDRSLDQDNSVSQACRVCIFTIQNQQRFLISNSDILQTRDEYLAKLSNNTKCLLYRRDHSNKDAIIKLRKAEIINIDIGEKEKQKQKMVIMKEKIIEKVELVSYKAPDGQIKQKYVIPLTQIIGLRTYQSQQDSLYKQSVLFNPKTIFQKTSQAQRCVSIIAIVGQQLSIRQIDVQFKTQQQRDEWVSIFRKIVSIDFKSKSSWNYNGGNIAV